MTHSSGFKTTIGRMAAGAGIVALALAVVLMPGAAFAQQNGSIAGKILDPDGLALPGASVTVSAESTGSSRTYTTSATGGYFVQNLQPARYTVTAEMPGFSKVARQVELSAGLEVTLNLSLRIGGLTEEVTVEGLAPLVEATSNKIGGSLSGREIEDVPSNFRNFTSLTQLIPGMTPAAAASSFEGGQVTANGSPAQSNVYLIDGMYNNDDRLGGSQGTQVRVVLDNIAEYQVLSNSYSAEYGGGAGAIVNMITRSGQNDFTGRVYGYYRDDKYNSRDHFLPAGDPKPKEQTLQYGIGLGGPIVKDKAHFYFTYEKDDEDFAKNKAFNGVGGALTQDFVAPFEVRANNIFARVDVQLNSNNFLSGRIVREHAPTKGEGFPDNIATFDQQEWEEDLDELGALTLTSTVSDRASNVFRVGMIHEQLNGGVQALFDFPNVVGIGFNNRDPFSIGQRNTHPTYETGQGGTGTFTTIHSYIVNDTFSYFVPDWGGEHTFKFGGAFSLARADPRQTFDSGTFEFGTNAPYDPNNPATYPETFDINVGPLGSDSLGGVQAFAYDRRFSGFIEDKWRTSDKLTLNLGVRYDRQRITPAGTGAIAPRLGFAYDVSGTGKSIIRGGVGRFFLYMPISGPVNQFQNAIRTLSPSISINASNDICNVATDPCVLRPVLISDSAGNSGVAQLNPAAQAFLNARRASALAGSTFNRNPRIDDPNRKLANQWAYSFGLSQELGANSAINIDYVGNISRDQTAEIDINAPQSGVLPGGARPQAAGFDPNGVLVTGEARNTTFRRVRQLQSNSGLNGKFNSLQVGVVRRFADRWSGRVSYTLQKGYYVGLGNPDSRTVSNNQDVASDYGVFASDRTHLLATTATVNVAGNLTISAVVSAISGSRINEVVGTDFNGDNNNNDRPIQGVSDEGRGPILSDLDGSGRAVINGIVGPSRFTVDMAARYSIPLGSEQRALDLFFDVFNVLNTENLNNPTGNRRSSNFAGRTSTSAGFARQLQMGARIRF